MKSYKSFFSICALTLLLLVSSCADLDVQNLGAGDTERVLATPADIVNLNAGAFVSWWQSMHTVSPGMALGVAADQLTCSWGNFGMRTLSNEPRNPSNNNLGSTDATVWETPWYNLYSALSTANDVVKAFDIDGKDAGADTQVAKASAYFLQGVSLGYLSLYFDQAFIVDETTDLASLKDYVPYTDVKAAALAKLDKCIAACQGQTFTLPASYINGTAYTSSQLAKIANSMAARILVYGSRTAADNLSVDWTKVLAYANNGIDNFDFKAVGDNNIWYDDYKGYSGGAYVNGNIDVSWGRADLRIINILDPSYPKVFPETGEMPEANSADSRLESDFLYLEENVFLAARGRYHFSNYCHNRYNVTGEEVYTGDMVDMLVAENDLFKAEALIRTGGSKSTAATLINKTRVGRGNLTALTGAESDAVLLNAVFYERDIELMNTGVGIGFFDMRRRDALQKGTFLHFGVPAKELTLLQKPIYTFGGVNAAGSAGTASGANSWK